MPAPIQSLNFDRPGLPATTPEQASVLNRVIEPLRPPFDLTGVASVVHNVYRCLEEFRSSLGVKVGPNHLLAPLLSSAELAKEWLTLPAGRPVVTLTEPHTLWSCVLVLDPERADRKLLTTIGAVYVLVSTGNSPPSNAELCALLQAAVSSGSDSEDVRAAHTTAALIACAAQVVKAKAQLLTPSASRGSAASDMVEARVEKALRGAYLFDCAPRTEGQPSVRGMTTADVVMTAEAVRRGAEAGTGGLLVAALSHWLGPLPPDMIVLRLFADQPGLVSIDPTSSFAIVRLEGVLTELARASMAGVLVAGDELVLPLPAWTSRLLRPLRATVPGAQRLRELPGLDLKAHELRRLFQTLDLPRRITPSKFVHDRAMPLIARQCDPLRLAAATMDWSRIHKVSAAYTHLTHGELLETLALRAELNRWGELSPSRVPDGGYLSKVTPSLEAVTALAATLLNDLRASYPGNNAGLDRLLAHHDAFIHYTAFMLSIGLLLRGQETTLLPASVLLLVMLPDFNDKALPYARAPLPEVCFGAAIRLQFRYLRAHYLAVADRLEQLARRGDTAQAEVARQLRRLAEGAPDLPLLVTIENGRLRAFSHLDLVRFLGEAWAGKADAIRHASSNVLRAEGFVYASREAAMRHIGGAQPITSSTSVWSRNDWYAESDRMQQALFSAIRLAPHGGLIRSLGRTA